MAMMCFRMLLGIPGMSYILYWVLLSKKKISGQFDRSTLEHEDDGDGDDNGRLDLPRNRRKIKWETNQANPIDVVVLLNMQTAMRMDRTNLYERLAFSNACAHLNAGIVLVLFFLFFFFVFEEKNYFQNLKNLKLVFCLKFLIVFLDFKMFSVAIF